MKKKIVLTGGGTAGHVWPHFALFDSANSPLKDAFENDSLEVHYFGTAKGLERDIVTSVMPKWHYHAIVTGKLRRYFSLQNFIDPFKVMYGIWQTFWTLKKIKPSFVFSKGGFVAAPVVFAAWLNRIPIVIHESDATPALATKLSLPFARKMFCAFLETIQHLPQKYRSKAQYVGLPLRASLFSVSKTEGRKYFDFENEKQVVLIFGGSLGAKGLNRNIAEVLPSLCEKYNILQITGKGNQIKDFSHQNYRQFEFMTHQMKYAYAAADLAICRAGASSIFELACARIPMILIPLGLQSSRGDQIINAQIFTQKGWAETYEESIFKDDLILETIAKNFTLFAEKTQALNSAPSLKASSEVATYLFDLTK